MKKLHSSMKKDKYDRWVVTAQSFDRDTGKPIGKSRDEVIVSNNELFKGTDTAYNVKERYEAFWNKMNVKTPKEVVFVSKVRKKR